MATRSRTSITSSTTPSSVTTSVSGTNFFTFLFTFFFISCLFTFFCLHFQPPRWSHPLVLFVVVDNLQVLLRVHQVRKWEVRDRKRGDLGENLVAMYVYFVKLQFATWFNFTKFSKNSSMLQFHEINYFFSWNCNMNYFFCKNLKLIHVAISRKKVFLTQYLFVYILTYLLHL